MNRPGKIKRGARRKAAPSEVGVLIEPLVDFLHKSGIGKKQLMAECGAAIRRASTANARLPVVHVEIGKDAIDIVNRWLRDPKYLNHNGRPDELPISGSRSVTSLVKDCGVAVSPNKALLHLLNFQIVRQVASKKYRLVRRSMDFWHEEYLPFEPNFRFLVDATRAATNRLQSQGDRKGLFWQCADNPRIPSKYMKDFLSFVKQRGLSFMHEINDWLDEHDIGEINVASRRGPMQRLGIGLFGIASDHD